MSNLRRRISDRLIMLLCKGCLFFSVGIKLNGHQHSFLLQWNHFFYFLSTSGHPLICSESKSTTLSPQCWTHLLYTRQILTCSGIAARNPPCLHFPCPLPRVWDPSSAMKDSSAAPSRTLFIIIYLQNSKYSSSVWPCPVTWAVTSKFSSMTPSSLALSFSFKSEF